MRLTLFDLDHTLLKGDSDQLWCEFLMDRGVLPREPFETLNRVMARDYAAGQVSAQAFCDFYIGTLAGRSADEWHSLRRDYIDGHVVPRITDAALELVARHRDAGDLVLLTTATSRFLSELTAVHLGIAQLIATECETGP
ncbi:MAG: haloacid dehalogenase-like hydrolase, partial [Burkholderiaceae bacterium]|nr:haloacid dehalogenase-like hydrolase [Burkholderiaceae bacterium]